MARSTSRTSGSVAPRHATRASTAEMVSPMQPSRTTPRERFRSEAANSAISAVGLKPKGIKYKTLMSELEKLRESSS